MLICASRRTASAAQLGWGPSCIAAHRSIDPLELSHQRHKSNVGSEELGDGGRRLELELERPDDGRVGALVVGRVEEEAAPSDGGEDGEGEVERCARLCARDGRSAKAPEGRTEGSKSTHADLRQVALDRSFTRVPPWYRCRVLC